MKLFFMMSMLMSSAMLLAADKPQENSPSPTPQEGFKMEMPERPKFEEFLPETVAVVDGKDLTRKEVIDYIDELSQNNMQFAFAVVPRLTTKEEVKNAIVESMINEQVLQKLASDAGYTISKETAKKFMDYQLKTASEAELSSIKKSLAQQNMTLDAYCEQFVENKSAWKGSAIQLWVIDKVLPTIEVTNEDVTAAAAQLPPQQMMSCVSDTAKNRAKAKLQEIASKIKTDTDFAKMAKEHSACPSGEKGGSLGEFGHGQMVPEFENIAFALKAKGDTSDVFESPFGFHIIRLESDPNPEKVTAAHILIKPEVLTKEDLTGRGIEAAKRSKVSKVIEEKVTEAKKSMKIEYKI